MDPTFLKKKVAELIKIHGDKFTEDEKEEILFLFIGKSDQCYGITSKKERCKKNVLKGLQFCSTHNKTSQTVKDEGTKKTSKVPAKKQLEEEPFEQEVILEDDDEVEKEEADEEEADEEEADEEEADDEDIEAPKKKNTAAKKDASAKKGDSGK